MLLEQHLTKAHNNGGVNAREACLLIAGRNPLPLQKNNKKTTQWNSEKKEAYYKAA
jgi:hypothetical protein